MDSEVINMKKTFLDIRVFNSYAPSNSYTSIIVIAVESMRKKRSICAREEFWRWNILHSCHIICYRELAVKCAQFYKKLASMIAEKKN